MNTHPVRILWKVPERYTLALVGLLNKSDCNDPIDAAGVVKKDEVPCAVRVMPCAFSLIEITAEPEYEIVVASDASNHNAHPGIFKGDKVLPGKLFSSPHLAAR